MIDPSKKTCALVVDMCAGQMRRPKIPHSTIYYQSVKESIGVFVNILNLYFCMLTIYNISEVRT